MSTTSLFIPLVVASMWLGAGSTYYAPDAVEAAGIRWTYDWSAQPPLYPGVESVPMLWGAGNVGQPVGGNSEWLLTFNEPDVPGQANIAPEDAVKIWFVIEQSYPNRRLVSPGVLNLLWLDQWWAAYVSAYGSPPRVDAVAMHCYGSWVPDDKCQRRTDDFVAWANERGIREVWVTEFARQLCYPYTEQGAVQFITENVAYWRTIPAVTRVAYFQTTYRGDEPWAFPGNCNTSLVDWETQQLTAVGRAYAGLAVQWR